MNSDFILAYDADKDLFPCCYPRYQIQRAETHFFENFQNNANRGKDTLIKIYDENFKVAKSGYKLLTEFVSVLNHLLWIHYDLGHKEMSEFYNELWSKTHGYAMDTLQDDELKFYMMVLD